MKHGYDFPISLTHPFKTKTKTPGQEGSQPLDTSSSVSVAVHRYLAFFESEPCLLLLLPKFLGKVFKVDLYHLVQENKLGRKLHKVKYIGKEWLPEGLFSKAIKINRYFFNAVLRQDSLQDDYSVFKHGSFQGGLLSKAEIESFCLSSEFFYFKNYLCLPMHLNFKAKEANCLENLCALTVATFFEELKQTKLAWKELKANAPLSSPNESANLDFSASQLHLKVFKSSKASKLRSSANFIFVAHFGSLREKTFGDYLKAVCKLSCKYFADDFTPDSFLKKILQEKQKTRDYLKTPISELLETYAINDIEENKYNYLHALSQLLAKLPVVREKAGKSFFLACLLPSVNSSIDYNFSENFQNVKSESNLFEDLLRQRLNLRRLCLVPVDEANPTCLECASFLLSMRSLSILSNFERAVVVKEFQLVHELDFIGPRHLFEALQNSGCDNKINFENFETLGDSALKLIASLYLFLAKDSREGDMTLARKDIICNENLERQAKQNDLAFFVRVHKRKAKNFVPPYFALAKEGLGALPVSTKNRLVLEQVISGKVQADVVEAILGAAFVAQNRLLEPLVVLKEFKIIGGYDFEQYENNFSQALLISPKIFARFARKRKSLSEKEKATNHRLFNFLRTPIRKAKSMVKSSSEQKPSVSFNLDYNILKALNKKPQNSQLKGHSFEIENHFLEDFQRRHLRYRFRNPALLKKALEHSNSDFERLEFLGDAVIEIFALCNFYHIMKKLRKKITPEIMHSLKLALLSTETLAKISRHFKMHRFFFGLKANQLDMINRYLKDYSKGQRFSELWFTSDAEAPKKMADGFEAIIGAAFLDGGWTAVKKILGEVFCSFIYFYAIYFQTMITDVKSEIINFFAKRGIKCEFQGTKNETSLIVTHEGESKVLCRDAGESRKVAEIKVCNKFFKEKKWLEFNKGIIV